MTHLRKRFSIAPMIAWTDRHCRAFHRQFCPEAILYTEMLTTGALIHGPGEELLRFDPMEHPVVLQLGGSDPAELARSAQMAEAAGFDAVNLNLGCPSNRVQKGVFGACLMLQPGRVSDCVSAMRQAVDIPVSVKCRIGIDQSDDYEFLHDFVETLAKTGIDQFIIHARKAILKGLSPAQNRTIPPLLYDRVYTLKSDFPNLWITLNGGVTSLAEARQHLEQTDSVMLGRAAYKNPWVIAEISHGLFGTPLPGTRSAILEGFLPYVEQQLTDGVSLHAISRHMHGLFNELPGARQYRRFLSENDNHPGVGVEVLRQAAALVREEGRWAQCSNA